MCASHKNGITHKKVQFYEPTDAVITINIASKEGIIASFKR